MRLAATTADATSRDTKVSYNPTKQPPLFLTPEGRVDWVDVAKGICIFFVVMMHTTLGIEADTGENNWMGAVVAWAAPFRIPDFFFIAGLFLMRTIDAPWRRYIDRKVVHFAYFYLIWMTIQGVLKGGLLTGSIEAIPGVLIDALYQPFGTLWFIYILPIFFIVTRLTKHVPIWAMLAIGAALEMAPIHTGYLLVDEFASRYVYFYAGYALAGYAFAMAERVKLRPMLALAALVGWAVINTGAVFTQVELMEETYRVSDLPVISLLLGILGALAVITAAALVARGLAGKVVLKTLSHMGGNSIVIYLAFFVPMVVLREVGLRLGLIPDHGTLSLLTTIVAVGSPLIGYWIIKKIGFGRFLFERSSWASIDENSRPRRAALTPAE